MKESTTVHQPLSRRAFLAKLAIVSPVTCLALCAQEAQADTAPDKKPTLTIRIGNQSNVHGPRGAKRTVHLCIKASNKASLTEADMNPCIVHCFTDCDNHPDYFDTKTRFSTVRAYCECCKDTHDMRAFVYTINPDSSFDNVYMYVKLPTDSYRLAESNHIHVPIGY